MAGEVNRGRGEQRRAADSGRGSCLCRGACCCLGFGGQQDALKSELRRTVSRPRTNIFPYSEQWETSAHLPSILFPLPVLS